MAVTAKVTPVWAEGIFDIATGVWGIEVFPGMTCNSNPHSIAFTANRQRATFTWEKPVHNADGTVVTTGNFTVISHAIDRIAFRNVETGLVSVMLIRPGGDEYTWGSPGTKPSDFYGTYLRCPQSKPSS